MRAGPDHAGEVRRALTDPAALARALGLKAAPSQGRAACVVCCPWHNEASPSCSVRLGPDGTIQVRCFGCSRGGDALHLIAAVRGLDIATAFPEVLLEAARIAGVDIGGSTSRGGSVRQVQAAPRPRPAPVAPDLDLETFHAIAETLLGIGRLDSRAEIHGRGYASAYAVDVLAYLDGRALGDVARAAGWGALPPAQYQARWIAILGDVFGLDALARSGLLFVRGDGSPDLDRFALPEARLVLPWRNPDGKIQTLQRRRIDAGKPKYAATSGRPPIWPYGSDRLALAPLDVPIAIVEGAADAEAFEALLARGGDRCVALGLQGVGAWTSTAGPRWGELARGRVAYVALDADPAGLAARSTIAADLAAGGARRVELCTPRSGKDWCDMFAEVSQK